MSHDWEKVLISPLKSIEDALKVIDKEAMKLALVVDESKRLLGTITDGDIRRALIQKKSLNLPVSEIMYTSPTTATLGTSRDSVLKMMEEKGLFFIPILEKGILVGLETLHNIVHQPLINENPVFIMAGGFGTRLRPLTDNCPKPMLKIGGVPILETLITSFAKAGFVNFYISTHYMPEQIHEHFLDGSEFGVKINYVHEDIPLGTGGALGLLPEDLPDLPLIMINGDVLTKVNFQKLIDFHIENEADATMCVREYEYQIPYGVIEGEGKKVVSMVEKPTHRFFVNAGIYVISPKVIKSVAKNQRIDMPTLLEERMSDDEEVLMFPIHEYWLDIGRMSDFKKAQHDIQSLDL